MSCAAFTFLGIYQVGFNKANTWVVGSSASLGAVLFFVASYRAWRRQHEDSVEAKSKLLADAPEVSLGFDGDQFVLRHRGASRGAIKVRLDGFETQNYRTEQNNVVAWLGDGVSVVLSAAMIDKRNGERYPNVDLKRLMIDSASGIECHLETTLRYQNPFGANFMRKVSYDSTLIEVHMDLPVPTLNHKIELDPDASRL